MVVVATAAGALVVGAGPSGARAGVDSGYFNSPNVKFFKNITTGAALIGGKVVGNHLYLSSYQDVEVFDISTPTNPVLTGRIPVNVERENEEGPGNGKIFGVSSSYGCQYYNPATDTLAPADGRWNPTPSSCLEIFDVRDPANPTLIAHIMGAGQHTSTCLFDCQYAWGQYGGEVTDLRHVLEPSHAASLMGNWMDHLPTLPVACTGNGPGSCDLRKIQCHNVTEVSPGLILAACSPTLLLSVRPEDGADVVHPRLLRYGIMPDTRFVHSTRWPNGGNDKFALVGGESNFTGDCSLQSTAALMTWTRDGDNRLKLLDQFRVSNGTYAQGNPPADVYGCSVHWFQEHPTFHDGGLVALGAYDNGTRFTQVYNNGKIVDRGFFLRPGTATWAAYWAPDGKTVYAIDDNYGLDVIQWQGPLYIPGQPGTDLAPPVSAAGPAAGAARDPLPNTSAGKVSPGPGTVPGIALLLLAAAGGFMVSRARRRVS